MCAAALCLDACRNFSGEKQSVNVLVFRIGQLGDTIAALPAFWALREHFKSDRLTLLSDIQHGTKYVVAEDILQGSGIFARYITYVRHRSRARSAASLSKLLLQLRREKFDTLVYLAPVERPAQTVENDRRFFRLAGIRNFIGIDAKISVPPKVDGQPLPQMPSEVDLNFARLSASGIPIPAPGFGRTDLVLGEAEFAGVSAWLQRQPNDGGRPWLSVGPGSKMPAKLWPEERFRAAVQELIQRYDFWPVVFGGPEDAPIAKRLIAAWKRGSVAASELNLRESALALRRCRLYLGNDTGTMHLAAASKVPCVAIFSARDHPGRYHPYGVPHRVLRKQIDCEGCMLVECVERRNECLNAISVDEVVEACASLWSEVNSIEHPAESAAVTSER